ncbi:acyl-CoA dehydrogenase family protein [Nocardioides ganghwensis]|uniref:Acyl-CoA dehydrogenase n=1 Tax=Nocardioides ganghwensis TaxID=252230 RepID=A0A4Q2SBG8_9ACTN|nr:acyl-CoA dehydrogenase family protein [Nocardioides ganghwensis]MBD3945111.1 acyl-CoA dehydrogenase [Nocardioides ganghwensis]RYB98607.1 acyl-CoA dehydrogenase [Nocardioides ganghwensis]
MTDDHASAAGAAESRPVEVAAPSDEERRELAGLGARARTAAGDVRGALALARDHVGWLPHPGTGRTAHLWSALATVAAADLTVARVLEPHLDAVAILAQADEQADAGTWGVFAAEGPGEPLRATPAGSSYVLDGRKHWCSLAGHLDHALVSAWVGADRRLFAVDLHHPGVTPVAGTWVARGLSSVDSGPVDMTTVEARPIGPTGWYLDRPGFAWGAIGVAAVWFGGAVGVARRMVAASASREPDQVALVHLGAVDARLHAARSVLQQAASALDAGDLTGADGWRAALRVRDVVADTCEEVVRRAAHGLGPAPLATDEDHARRVADLDLYLRQWHAERDQAGLGRLLLDDPVSSW